MMCCSILYAFHLMRSDCCHLPGHTWGMFLHAGNCYQGFYWWSQCITQGCSLTRYIETYLATSQPPWPSKTPKTLHLLSTFNAARCASSCNYTQVSTSDLAHVQIIRGCKCVHATDKVVRPALADMSLKEKQQLFTISVRQPCIAQTPYLKSAFSSSSPSCSNRIASPLYNASSMPFQQCYCAEGTAFCKSA